MSKDPAPKKVGFLVVVRTCNLGRNEEGFHRLAPALSSASRFGGLFRFHTFAADSSAPETLPFSRREVINIFGGFADRAFLGGLQGVTFILSTT